METHFLWLIVGIVLIVAELLTGTFYLLFLGIAALVGAAAAFLGAPFWAQAVVTAACSVAGVMWVQRHRRAIAQAPMRPVDYAQPVSFLSWIDQAAHVARVKYRDADWDAQVSGECSGKAGEILYITQVDGNMLKVSKTRPA
jgi:membrane protein implicated in regulation of membrane protease activity